MDSRELIRILFVEDDDGLAQLTAEYLEGHAAVVEVHRDGSSALAALAMFKPDVVLLDVMLPGQDGLEVCRRIRQRSDVPIVMLTARDEEADRVMGLEMGADDYVTKPFSSRELLARVRAQSRRARGQVGPSASAPLRVGELVVEPAAMRATLRGMVLPLTTTEFALLRALAERPGCVLTREQLLELVKGSAAEAFDRSIDVHISRLRHKLGDDPRQPALLKTVRGAGYLLAQESG